MIYHLTLILKVYDTSSYHGNVTFFIEVIRSNWHINAMLRLFKTNVLTSQFKRSSYLIDLLENFVLERGIYGKRWLDEDIFSIDQFSRMGRKSHQLTEGHQALYKEVIKLKKNVINKVLYFEQAMNEAHTVKDYATSFYESLNILNYRVS